MKRWLIAIIIVAVLGGVSWALWPSPAPAPADPSTVPVAVEPRAPPSPRSSGIDVPDKVTAKRRVDAAERERYRRYIAKQIDEHRKRGGPSPAANDAPSARERAANDDTQPSAGLRMPEPDAKLQSLLGALQEDFMPLADECYEAALERDPSLQGLLDVNFEVIGDEDIGGLVESFELGDENELHDEELIECMRETMLSTLFPPPEGTDRTGARLTLKLHPDEE